MAQNGNSCSNPYVMNLTNGAGNAEFQFHYPDTVMYVKVLNISDKQLFSMQIDSLAILDFKKISIINSNCQGNYIYDVNMNSSGNKNFNFKVDFNSDIDTILIVLQKLDYNPNCSGCDTLLLKFKLLVDQVQGGTQPCIAPYPNYCKNLLLNAGFELHIPTLMPLDNVSGGAWEDLQFDNQVCEWFPAFPSPLSSPDYYTSYWNGYAPGALNCSFCASHSLTANQVWCNDPLPQSGNPFFDGINEAYAGVYSFHLSATPEILRGQLDPDPANQLIQNHIYYIEGNFAQPHGIEYYGHMEIDVTNQPNFIQANYNAATTGIEIAFDAFDYDAANPWRKFYNVFTSNGDETNIFIGNLTQKVTSPQSAGTSPTCTELLTASIPYMLIDNIVVKEFLADAGGPTISVCNNVPTTIGGSCEYPTAQYNWQPANLFNNNTLANPLITTNTNVTCTLTVTIPLPNGQTATTPPAYINVEVLQNPTVSINGSTQVIIGNSTTLTASGALYYTWTATNGNTTTTGSGAELETGNLFQQETFTVTGYAANGCSSTASITIGTIQWPTDCGIAIANLQNVVEIPNGDSDSLIQFLTTNFPDNISNVGLNAYDISSSIAHPINFSLAGNLIINNGTNLSFNASNHYISGGLPINIICFDGSEIINYGNLEMNSCSLTACNNMWKGITNHNKLYMNGNYIADAENAVHLANASNYKISTNVFDNNLYGILMGGNSGGQITGVDYSNIFRSTSQLKPAHATMFFHPNWSEAGIKVFNVNYVQIGAVPAALSNSAAITISNRFENINCGINIFNSNVKVVNSWFKDLTHLNPSPVGTLIGLQPEGSGIYARSIGTPKSLSVEPIPGYTGNEFEKCKYGIKTFRNSIVANNIRMNNVANGITAQNTIMCSYNLQSNRINAWLNGIEINNAEFANNIVIAYNQINMNFLMGYFGINVSGATMGNDGNTRINNNIVTIANTYNAGIQTSSLKGSLVNCNSIRRMITNPFMPWYSLNGINSLTCDNITLSQNTVSWAPGFNGSPNMGIDILLELSDEAMVRCNTTGASRIGLQVAGANPNSTIRANNFGSNDIALRYDNSGVTGPQPADPLNDDTEGNRWLGTNTFKAINDAIGSNAYQSIYYVNANQPAINNPDQQLIFPPGWFLGTGLTSYQPPCLIQNCAGRMVSSMGNLDFYRSIANRSLRTNGYPEQTLWMAQNTLVKLLTNDSILLNDDDSLHYFYYSPDAQVLRDIDEIGRNNTAFEAQRNLFSHAIIANDSLMSILESGYLGLNSELTDSLANDSLILMQKIALLAQYESLIQINEDLSHSLNDYHKANLSLANDLNRALEPRNANEQILKTVNEIYFTLRDNEYEYISNDDADMLAYIAHLCPLAAGPAVFKARDLYALLVDSVLYQDSANCSREGYAREGLTPFVPKINKNEIEVKYFKAFPVPAQNTLNLSFSELKSAAIVYVYDMEGRLLLSKNISSNSKNAQLELSQIPTGVYYVLLVNNERTERTKISVIK